MSQTKTEARTGVAEYDAIAGVVQLYIDGSKNGTVPIPPIRFA